MPNENLDFKFFRCQEYYFITPARNLCKIYEIIELNATGTELCSYFSQHVPYEYAVTDEANKKDKEKFYLGATFVEAAAKFMSLTKK
jgi:hypothetical protein